MKTESKIAMGKNIEVGPSDTPALYYKTSHQAAIILKTDLFQAPFFMQNIFGEYKMVLNYTTVYIYC